MQPGPPDDPADHAEDFSRRYAEDLDLVAGQAMLNLGLPVAQIGARDHDRGSKHHCFFPTDRTGGSVSPAGQITLDSGLMNPELLSRAYDDAAQAARKRTRIRDRAQAILAHELAEHEYADRELALIAAPESRRPLTPTARALLRQMERGWIGR